VLGGTDIAIRRYVPRDLLTFTVNRSMFERICSIGEDGFIGGRRWRDVKKLRGPG